MDFAEGTDELPVIDGLSQLLQGESSRQRIRAAESDGFDRQLWGRLLDFGLLDMAASAKPGEPGLGLLLRVSELCGSYLVAAPVVETLAAVQALLIAGQSAGEIDGVAQSIVGRSQLWAVTLDDGPSPIVSFGAHASTVLRVTPAALARFDGRGDHRRFVRVHGTIPAARYPMTDAGQVISWSAGQWRRSVSTWRVLAAGRIIGAARQAVREAAAYTAVRESFGVLIGSKQGVAHPLATAWTELTAAYELLRRAAWATETSSASAASLVDLACALTVESSRRAVGTALHVHGGYGACMEYDTQLFHQRVTAWSLLETPPQQIFQAHGCALVQGA